MLLVAFDGVTLVDIVGPADVFFLATRYILPPLGGGYEVTVASVGGGDVVASNGMTIRTEALADLDGHFDTIIVPGGGPPETPPIPMDVVGWLRRNAASTIRICSICTGTFLLGAAGLITGRRVTTHWQSAAILQKTYPHATVDPAPLYICDGNIWTSAGFSAGSDMAIALIERDFGHHVAIEVARRLVVFLKRDSEIPQISTALFYQASSDEMFSRLHAWIMANLNADLSVAELAEFVGMTPRTFARAYTERLGRTPAKTVEILRLEAAFRLLVTSEIPLKRIAVETGFGDEQNMRRAFFKGYDQTPAEVRRSHRTGNDPSIPNGTFTTNS